MWVLCPLKLYWQLLWIEKVGSVSIESVLAATVDSFLSPSQIYNLLYSGVLSKCVVG
jgi:hypothetical protein